MCVGGGKSPNRTCSSDNTNTTQHLYQPAAKSETFTFHIKDLGRGTFTHDLNILAPAYNRDEEELAGVGERQIAVVGASWFRVRARLRL